MIQKIVGWFLIVLFSIIAFVFIRSGAYKSVQIEKTQAPKFQLFYAEHIGPYHEIIEKLTEVETELKKLKHPCKKTFGHFLSDPKIVEHAKLISHVGCAFEEASDFKDLELPEGINHKFFGENLSGKICYKGTFSGSPALSAMKVYPKLIEASKKDGVELSVESFEVSTVLHNEVTPETYLCEK